MRPIGLLLCLLLAHSPLWAAVGVNGVASVGVVGAPGASVSLTTADTNRVLIACAYIQDFVGGGSTPTSSFTYAGVPLTLLRREVNFSGALIVEKWRLIAPALGANLLAISLPENANIVIGGINFTGVDQSTPNGTPVSGQGLVADPNLTYSGTGSADGLLTDCLGMSPSEAVTAEAGQTSRYVTSGATDITGAASTKGGAGTQNFQWNETVWDSYNVYILTLMNPVVTPPPPATDRRRSGPMVPR